MDRAIISEAIASTSVLNSTLRFLKLSYSYSLLMRFWFTGTAIARHAESPAEFNSPRAKPRFALKKYAQLRATVQMLHYFELNPAAICLFSVCGHPNRKSCPKACDSLRIGGFFFQQPQLHRVAESLCQHVRYRQFFQGARFHFDGAASIGFSYQGQVFQRVFVAQNFP